MSELPKAVLGQTPVEEVHAALKTLAEDLVARYAHRRPLRTTAGRIAAPVTP